MEHDPSRSGFSHLIQLIKQTLPAKRLIGLCIGLVILHTALSLLVPLQTKTLLDAMSTSQRFNWADTTILAGVLFLASAISGVQHYILGKLGNEQKRLLRNRLFNHLLHLPVAFFDKTLSGEPANRIVKDSEIIESLVSQHAASFLSGLVSLLGSFVILWFLEWRLTLVLFLAVLVSFAFIYPFARKISGLSKSLQDKEANYMANISEWFGQVRLLKSFTALKQIQAQSASQVDALYETAMKEQRILALMSPMSNLALMMSIIGILGYGATLVSSGVITIGTFVAFIMFLLNIVFPVMQLSMFFSALNKAAGAAMRIHELLDIKKEANGSDTSPIPSCDIELHNVHFAYHGSAPVLNGLTLKVAANKTTALVATSGGGKSTLFSLLLGYYEAGQGHIYLGGKDIRTLDKSTYLSKFGVVSQETPVLSGTLRSNLLLGLSHDPSLQDINNALDNADLSTFISQLDEGLDTQVGERGITLSGGQRQRLALARALLRNPDILLLDEVTASLDANSESRIQAALEAATSGRTTLIAAHRLATIRHADNIVCMDNGKVIAQGTHDELLRNEPLYRELVKKQFHHEETAQTT